MFLKIKDVKFTERCSLSKISHIGIGGTLAMLVMPATKDELMSTLSYLAKLNIDYRIVGRMTNILPSDSDFDGVIVKTDLVASVYKDKNTLIAECGVSLPKLAYTALTLGLSGLEELSGIPGSVGGAICGNAGAFGKAISDVFVSAELYDTKCDKLFAAYKDELEFRYRSSALKNNGCILISAKFALREDSKEKISEKMQKFKEQRLLTQPLGNPTLGSVFKRPSVGFASKMVDECGLRGYRVGSAMISQKHAGFIENIGGATAEDYRRLIEIARARVLVKFGIILDTEIEIW